ncbi:M56 family metallopeptidase [Flavobacterium ajazii]|uniref:M56 family metallopeptidase n=1 Tax=Flavobacterium ajazii TaxID=2692318 RepID=UPI0013D59BBB|nr:M56 family metallopeptidase [Flavobacterium ajazii]
MEALYIYVAKSSGLIVLFYCAYYFLLRKETFFNNNRYFLLTGLITSALLPFLVYTKIVWIDPVPATDLNFPEVYLSQTPSKKNFEINWNYIILSLYCIGFLIFLIKLVKDFYHLNSVLKSKKIQKQADYKLIDTTEKIAPFSYFKYIVYNSSMYTTSELENIIEHEKVHSDQNHSADVLISQIFCLLFWFNPIIWLYKKVIVQNLEFIADKEASRKISDKKAYQYTLLKITTHESCVAITNHFYQSLIKKRIVMLNKNQSKKRNLWKYYVILPALTAFMLLFQVEIVAQEKGPKNIENINPDKVESMDVFTINKNTTNDELDKKTKALKDEFNISANISELERNSKNEITSININLKNENGVNKTKKIISNKGIEKIGIIVIKEKNGTISFNLTDSEPITTGYKTEDKNIQIRIKDTQISNINNDAKTNSNTDTDIHTNVSTNTSINKDGNIIRVVTKNDTKPLIIINGDVSSPDLDIKDIDPNKINSINVLKGSDATAKYGDLGSNGVIEIITKDKTEEPQQKTEKETEIKQNNNWKVTGHKNSENVLSIVAENQKVDIKKILIVIDGKITNKTANDLDPQNIEQINVLKEPTSTTKYGNKGKNGVIEITTKK